MTFEYLQAGGHENKQAGKGQEWSKKQRNEHRAEQEEETMTSVSNIAPSSAAAIASSSAAVGEEELTEEKCLRLRGGYKQGHKKNHLMGENLQLIQNRSKTFTIYSSDY